MITPAILILLIAVVAIVALASSREAQRARMMIARDQELRMKQAKYHWNPLTFRYELEPHQLEALSFKEVTPQEIYHVMGSIEYNPTHHYKDKIKLIPREMGHDLEYRYIAKLNNK